MKKFGMTHFAVKRSLIKRCGATVLLGFFLIATFLTPVAKAQSKEFQQAYRSAENSDSSQHFNKSAQEKKKSETKPLPAFNEHAGSESSSAYEQRERKAGEENERPPQYEKAPNEKKPQYKKIDEPERPEAEKKEKERQKNQYADLKKPETQTSQAKQEQESENKNNNTSTWTKNNSAINLSLPGNSVEGSMIYRYSLDVPPGQNGIQPDVALVYNSSETDPGNQFGYGWSTTIPYIERINKTGTDSLYSTNYFNSSLTGELVNILGTSYGSKVDNGEFLTYTFSENIWTVKNKEGTVYTFGGTVAARQDDPANASRIYKWMLQEMKDRNNNSIQYQYHKDAGQIYADKIIYTGNGVTDGIFEVEFIRSSRNDVTTSHKTAFAVTSSYLITEINTKINKSWTRKYAFTYTPGRNGSRSLLDSITETGKNESGYISSLPATNFDYQASANTWINDSSNWMSPVDLGEGVNVVDVNGDSLADLLQYTKVQGSDKRNAYIHNGSGWTSDNTWLPPEDMKFYDNNYAYDYDLGVRAVDLNGDGRTDLIRSNNAIGKKVYINNGAGWTEDTGNWLNFNGAIAFTGGNQPYSDQGGRIIDINGDGLPDLIKTYRYPMTGNISTTTQLNTGNGWVDANWNSPVNFQEGAMPVELNGDGLVDFIIHKKEINSATKRQAYINNGSGWTPVDSFAPPIEMPFMENNYDLGVRAVDVNADGLADLIQSQYNFKRLYVNNGNGWTEATDTMNDWNSNLKFIDNANNGDGGTRTFDVNGDGIVDLFKGKKNPYNGIIGTTVDLNTGTSADLLKIITYPTGGKSEITYKATTAYASNSALLNADLPFVFDTVYQINNFDGFNPSSTKTFRYEGGKYYFNTATDRKLAGFEKIIAVDSEGYKVIHFYHQGNSSDTSNGEHEDHISKLGKSYRIEIVDSNENIYSKIINKWENTDLGNARKFTWLSGTVATSFDEAPKSTAESYEYNSKNGNLQKETMWGEVQSNENGTFGDVGSDQKSVTYTYAINTDNQESNFVSEVIAKDAAGQTLINSRSYYDNQPLSKLTKGNPTSEENWLETKSTFIPVKKTYNSYGLVTSFTDANGNKTSAAYDAANLYPQKITNALGHEEQYTYDPATGNLLEHTDANATKTIYTYDGLGRILKVTKNSVLLEQYEYEDTALPNRITKKAHASGTLAHEVVTYLDGLGRTIQTRTSGEKPDEWNVTNLLYNNRGQIASQTLPFFENGKQWTSFSAKNPKNSFTYDALGRLTQLETPIGITKTIYSPWKKTIIDPAGRKKVYSQDAYGRLIQVDEYLNEKQYSTKYEYDLLGNLTKITDAAGNIRNFTYDSLGRRTQAQDLHAPSDETFAVWTYSYDDNGNLKKETNIDGSNISYTYDSLNRVLAEEIIVPPPQAGLEPILEDEPPVAKTLYEYDTAKNSIGRLSSSSRGGVKTSYEYDTFGNIAKEIREIASSEKPAESFVSLYQYDNLSRPISQTAPNNIQTLSTYNSAGLLEKMDRKNPETTDNTAIIPVIINKDYNASGQIVLKKFANAVTETYEYDNGNRLIKKTTKNDTPLQNITLQSLSYEYDATGNITHLIDSAETSVKRDIAYSYDDLDRLITVTLVTPKGTETLKYEYDILGNILKKPGVGTYQYEGATNDNPGNSYANPHAVTTIIPDPMTTPDGTQIPALPETFKYDQNGNLIEDNSRLLTWNAKNELLSVSVKAKKGKPAPNAPTGTTTFVYDANGNRVQKKTKLGVITNYITPAYEIESFLGKETVRNYLYDGQNLVETLEKTEGKELPLFSDAFTSIRISNKKWTKVSGKWNEIFDQTWTEAGKNASSRSSAQVEQSLETLKSLPQDSSFSYEFDMTFPEAINVSQNPAVTGQYGAGFYFMAENPAAVYGNKSYLLFQTADTMKIFKGNGGTLTELASFAATTTNPTNAPPFTFNYTIEYTPITDEIRLFRDSAFIGSYTDSSPIQSGTSIILMAHFTKTSFDNIEVKAGTKTETKTYNTHVDHLGSSSVVTQGLTLNGQLSPKTGQIVQSLDQYPYGEKRIDEKSTSITNGESGSNPDLSTTNISSFSTKKTFTGKELDAETGLYYYGARYYDSRLGRFISLDPASRNISEFQLFTNPQRFNSYSYSLNNPVRYQDPTGKSAVGATAEWILTGIGWVLAVIEPTPAGEIAMTMISAGKTTIFVADTIQEGIEKFNKMAEANTKNKKIGKGIAEAHKKGETEGGSGMSSPEKNNDKDTEKNGKNESKIQELAPTLKRIEKGEKSTYKNDGKIFENREGRLPEKPKGYYKEFVHPTDGIKGPGIQRIIQGKNGELYYSSDHYKNFIKIK